jgi:hypothetical protein
MVAPIILNKKDPIRIGGVDLSSYNEGLSKPVFQAPGGPVSSDAQVQNFLRPIRNYEAQYPSANEPIVTANLRSINTTPTSVAGVNKVTAPGLGSPLFTNLRPDAAVAQTKGYGGGGTAPAFTPPVASVSNPDAPDFSARAGEINSNYDRLTSPLLRGLQNGKITAAGLRSLQGLESDRARSLDNIVDNNARNYGAQLGFRAAQEQARVASEDRALAREDRLAIAGQAALDRKANRDAAYEQALYERDKDSDKGTKELFDRLYPVDGLEGEEKAKVLQARAAAESRYYNRGPDLRGLTTGQQNQVRSNFLTIGSLDDAADAAMREVGGPVSGGAPVQYGEARESDFQDVLNPDSALTLRQFAFSKIPFTDSDRDYVVDDSLGRTTPLRRLIRDQNGNVDKQRQILLEEQRKK